MLKDLADHHDLNNLRAALRHFDGRSLAVDVGAHRGIWMQEMAGHFDQVVAFEPVRSNYTRQPLLDNVKSYNVAIGNEAGEVVMDPGTENTGQWHVSKAKKGFNVAQILPLDNFSLQPDFIKIDTEGYELFVLQGAEKTIFAKKPAILVELNGLTERYSSTDGQVVEWLTKHGYVEVMRRNKDYLFVWSGKVHGTAHNM